RRLAPAGLSMQTLREYFRYHGLMAPGVRLLRALPISMKVAVVAVCFLVPVLVMAALHFRTTVAELERTSREVAGVRYVQPLLALQQDFREERQRVMMSALSGSAAGMSDIEQRTDAAFARMVGTQAQYGELLQTAAAWEAVRKGHLAARAAAGDAPTLRFEKLNRYADELVELTHVVLLHSGLEVEHDPGPHLLGHLVVEKLPDLMERLFRVRGQVTALLSGQADVLLQMRAAQQLAFAQDALAAVLRDLKELAPLGTALDPRMADARTLKPMQQFLDSAQAVVMTATPTGQPAAFLVEGQAAIAAATALHGAAQQAVEQMLLARQQTLTRELRASQALVGTLTFLGLYLLWAFHRVMDGGLNMLKAQVAQMARGDLTMRRSAWGRDEVAVALASLGQSLNRLSDLFAAVRAGAAAMAHASHSMSSGTGDLTNRTQGAAVAMAEIMGGVTRYIEEIEDCGRHVDEAMSVVQTLRVDALRNHENMQRLDERMRALKGKSREIGEIVEIIDHISFRTNILALNASVEAAKAGPAGRGFAVVALEVRSLAQRSAESARRIGGIVGASTEDIEQAGALADLSAKSMAETDRNVTRIHGTMDQIVALTRTGLQNSQAILAQIREVDAMSADNHTLVQQMASASEDLSRQGDRLNEKVRGFKLT
ncbi:MAG: methyl-accepting chemotaxis protein, partial [Aquabacterium sp.]